MATQTGGGQGGSGIGGGGVATAEGPQKQRAFYRGQDMPGNFTSREGLAWPSPINTNYYFFQPDGSFDVHTVTKDQLQLEEELGESGASN